MLVTKRYIGESIAVTCPDGQVITIKTVYFENDLSGPDARVGIGIDAPKNYLIRRADDRPRRTNAQAGPGA